MSVLCGAGRETVGSPQQNAFRCGWIKTSELSCLWDEESPQRQGHLRRAQRPLSGQNHSRRAAEAQRKDFLEVRAACVGKDDPSYMPPVAVTLVLATTKMQPS